MSQCIQKHVRHQHEVGLRSIFFFVSEIVWLVQDMPEGGLHGIFPALRKGEIFIAGGADISSLSHSSVHYKLTL